MDAIRRKICFTMTQKWDDLSNLRHISRATILFALAVALSTQAFAANKQKCAKYANLAMKDFVYGSKRCQIQPDSRWQPNYEYHFSWCLTASDSALAAECDARKKVLIDCGVINATTPRPEC